MYPKIFTWNFPLQNNCNFFLTFNKIIIEKYVENLLISLLMSSQSVELN